MPNPEKSLTREQVDLAAERFRVLSDRTRLRILQVLRRGEASIGEVVVALGVSQPTVSKHLATLARAGMVARRQEGTRVLCSIADPLLLDLCDLVCGALSEDRER